MSAVIEAEHCARWYGQVLGLAGLSTRIQPGITALVGPNGAGKSTFIKLISGQIKPSSGKLEVMGGRPFNSPQVLRQIGYVPADDVLYNELSAQEILRYLLRLSGKSRREARELGAAALEEVGLTSVAHRPVRTFSKGMRQRVRLAQGIAHSPKLLIADEPLTGLDPQGRREVLSLLAKRAENGMSLLISSHVLHELETLTSEMILIANGRKLAQGTVGEIRALLRERPRKIALRATHARALASSLMKLDHVVSITTGKEASELLVKTTALDQLTTDVQRIAATEAPGIQSMSSPDDSLEAVFEDLTTRPVA